ncbi:MAG: class B sortase [Eubacteriales bacterium]|nr:class B sortase [Eubacteriales bacterium]
MKKYIKWGIFTVLFLAILFLLFLYWDHSHKNEDVYDKLAKTYETVEEEEPEDTGSAEELIDIPIDFAALQQENPDIYAWIRIPDTTVDYPILQSSTDNSYYLNHTVDHQTGFPGSIYTENLNAKDFSDPNTVIYGHKMNNDTMFGGLYRYADETYLKEHAQIYIYTPDHILTYQVFAAVTYDNRHIMYSFDFTDPTQYQAYFDSLRSVRNMSTYWDESIDVTIEDRIITLSTCNGNDAQRFLVEAVLIDEK